MTIPVLMPKIGLTMTEGKIVEWKKKEGEWVEKEEILFVFETEKVTIEVEAQQSGFLVKILVQVDGVAAVGAQVGILAETLHDAVGPAPGKAESIPAPVEERMPEPRIEKPHKIRATPMAKRLARERGIDLNSLPSPDAGGRIRMKDVEAAPADARASGKVFSQEIQEETPGQVATPCSDEGRLVKLTGMRRVIAQKMLASKLEAAQTYMVVSVNAEKLLEARKKLKAATAAATGASLTITDLLMKVTASAVLLHPVINTRWSSDGIIWLDAVHMGMAMALDEGLIVPVIRDIGNLSLAAIAKKRAELVEKGRASLERRRCKGDYRREA